MAANTVSRVDSTTPGKPFETRETVWVDTPARRATSAIETRRTRRPCGTAAAPSTTVSSPSFILDILAPARRRPTPVSSNPWRPRATATRRGGLPAQPSGRCLPNIDLIPGPGPEPTTPSVRGHDDDVPRVAGVGARRAARVLP